MNVFSRGENESEVQWVLRLHTDPWFDDMNAQQLADFTGVPLKKVRRALYSWAKSARVRRMHAHAVSVAEQIGWPGTPDALVHLALELYIQRFRNRAKEAYDLDGDIKRFLAENATAEEHGIEPHPPSRPR